MHRFGHPWGVSESLVRVSQRRDVECRFPSTNLDVADCGAIDAQTIGELILSDAFETTICGKARFRIHRSR
jgi:hypothetical protein